MTILKAIVLAVIQGLTEFLPVSSSGHLALANRIFPGMQGDLTSFFLILHFGTMFATLWVFWDEVIALIKSLGTIPQAIRTKEMNNDLKMVVYIVIGSIPAVLAGYFLKDKFDALATNMTVVGVTLLATALILFLTLFLKGGKRDEKDFGIGRAFVVGLAQAVAILPGLSRSGSTISTALYLEGDRKFAGRFSFLMSLPVIFGANIVELFGQKTCPLKEGKWIYLLGFFVAFGMGLLALKVLLKIVEKGKFYWFAVYCFLLGGTTLVLSLAGVL